MKSWKTTLCGLLAALCTAGAATFTDYKDVLIAAAGLFGALGLIFAKDSNVTGGTTPQ
jgi:hypothetical protein